MKVSYQPAFIRDLRQLRGRPEYERIYRLVFEAMPRWAGLAGQAQVKCLSGRDHAYRVRVRDYRIGFYWRGEVLIVSRVLHRREIYRYFP
ncbi:MAG: type II toxin-antitoxin system RelE/ParE family toxin [Verrucomicrobia bacterium]|nr:type II toxin-antitoxin system RelE/ParE family toxin [Verrucomicrobiota bacterium]